MQCSFHESIAMASRVPSTSMLPSPRPSRIHGRARGTITRVTQEMFLGAHPDAIRRRREAEERHRAREEERRLEKEQEAAGVSWFQSDDAPENMRLVNSLTVMAKWMKLAADSNKLLVADFFTPDCYSCKSLYPKLKQIAKENPDVLFAKLNGQDEKLSPYFETVGVKKVPFFRLYRDHKLVSSFSASLSPEKLANLRMESLSHYKGPQAI
eukprot:gene18060-24484_t